MTPTGYHELLADPLEQFATWFRAAQQAGIDYPNAMALATSNRKGVPSVRMVLMRGFDARGFRFYTNYNSNKGQQLIENPRAALLFYWEKLDRQVRIQALVEKLSAEESDAYFANRPYQHQLSAWASPQSQPVVNRSELEKRLDQMRDKYESEVPRPPHWGGYLAQPQSYEFWQQREGRLHDRFLYSPTSNGAWQIQRLAP